MLDAALMAHATINAHPLVNTMTTSIARDDLVRFLEATGHPPRIVRGRRARFPERPERPDCIWRFPGPFNRGTQCWSGAVRAGPDARRGTHDDVAERRGSGGRGGPEGLIKETTTQGFMKDVIEESKRQPVLIDFWAPWCGPCKQLTPILEKVVKAAKGKVKLVKMNIDEHPAIPGQMGIQSIPAVIAFVNGQPADGFMGALPESQVTGLHRAADQGQGRRRDARIC